MRVKTQHVCSHNIISIHTAAYKSHYWVHNCDFSSHIASFHQHGMRSVPVGDVILTHSDTFLITCITHSFKLASRLNKLCLIIYFPSAWCFCDTWWTLHASKSPMHILILFLFITERKWHAHDDFLALHQFIMRLMSALMCLVGDA